MKLLTAFPVSPAQLRIAEIAFWLALASSFFLLPDKLTLMSQIMIFGLFAVSLDMALGYAGILTVGHAAFFGAGAYAAGLLAKYGWSEPFTGLCSRWSSAACWATCSATSWCAAPTSRG
jgi:branched-chain amino acid transport system permease protein